MFYFRLELTQSYADEGVEADEIIPKKQEGKKPPLDKGTSLEVPNVTITPEKSKKIWHLDRPRRPSCDVTDVTSSPRPQMPIGRALTAQHDKKIII